DLKQVKTLLDSTTQSTFCLNVLLRSGDLWSFQSGSPNGPWHYCERLPNMEKLLMAKALPETGQLLFVWNFGRGYDQIMLKPALWREGETAQPPDALNQTALVKINEEDEGLWRGWGRETDQPQPDGSIRKDFSEGFASAGEDAVRIQSEQGDAYFKR